MLLNVQMGRSLFSLFIGDIVVAGDDPLTCLERLMLRTWSPLHYFLAIEVARSSSNIFIFDLMFLIPKD